MICSHLINKKKILLILILNSSENLCQVFSENKKELIFMKCVEGNTKLSNLNHILPGGNMDLRSETKAENMN